MTVALAPGSWKHAPRDMSELLTKPGPLFCCWVGFFWQGVSFWVFIFLVFQDRVSLCSPCYPGCPWLSLLCRPGWPRTHRDPSVPASQVLGLKV